MRNVSRVVCCVLCAGVAWAQDAELFRNEIVEKAKGLEIVGGGIDRKSVV